MDESVDRRALTLQKHDLVWDRYEVRQRFGLWRTGPMYGVRDRELGEPLALKIMFPSVIQTESAQQAFATELGRALMYRHEGLVTVRDFGQDKNRDLWFFTTDIVNCVTLDHLLKERAGKLSVTEAVHVARRICGALEYLHEHTTHGGLEPHHVAICHDWSVKLLEVGLVRLMTLEHLLRSASADGAACYFAPEHTAHLTTLDHRTDIYCLGVMLYEMLTGDHPAKIEVLPSQKAVRLPKEFDAIIARCLELDPDKRYQSASDLERALAEAHDEPLEAVGKCEHAPAASAPGPPTAGASCNGLAKARRLAKQPPPASSPAETGPQAVRPVRSAPPELFEVRSFAGIEFVWVPPGRFHMGSLNTEAGHYVNETRHRVTLTQGFWLGRFPVTQAQWREVTETDPSETRGDDLPVNQVSWDECRGFIHRLNRKGGGKFRLPTEAEWEYACRAGSVSAYCFGDAVSRLHEYAWYNANSDGQIHAVGQLKPNAWGLYDMHGNVSEWCQDFHDDRYYTKKPDFDPKGPRRGVFRVFRGGCWNSGAVQCRCAARGGQDPGPGYHLRFHGLRLARNK